MNPQYIILEGPDGGGHSLHVEYLALGLRKQGARARAWTHPKHPAGAEGLARVHHYINSRHAMEGSCDVVVMDRGPWAGVAHARAVEALDWRRRDSGLYEAMHDAVEWAYAHVVYLDAPDEVLDQRLYTRGEAPEAAWAERRVWRQLAREQAWTWVDTSGPPAETHQIILEHATRVLKAPVPA